MAGQNSVSSEWIKFVVDGLASQGVDCRELCEKADLDYNKLCKPNSRLSQDKFTDIWREAINITGDQGVGLEFVKSGLHHQLKPLVFTFISNKSLKEAFEKIIPYQEVMSTGVKLDVLELEEGYLIQLSHVDGDDVIAAPGADLTLGTLVALAKWVMPQEFNPLLVEFEHDRFTDLERYDEVFGCDIRFSSNRNGILFSKRDFEASIVTADQELSDYTERLKNSDLQRIRSKSTAEQIRLDVAECLASGNATIEALATKYCMTTRTLQRRLKLEGWTFRELVDETRRVFAEEYIGKQKKSVDESTRLLGFSETSSFIRAFKRWYNMTPNQYKKEYRC